MSNIFEKRENLLPYEYPQLIPYADAINKAYWLVSEFNFTQDIQDFKTVLTEEQRGIIERAMLAISQIEVSVKTYWADLYRRLPKPEVAIVGMTFAESECFDEKTKVLTSKGFRYFKDITKGSSLAQFDLNTSEITYSNPISLITRPYEGIMHNYLGKSTDIMVTPNHNIVVKRHGSRSYKKSKSSGGKWYSNWVHPSAGYKKSGGKRELTDEERLLIAIQADGSIFGTTTSGKGRRDFSFQLTKENKIERLESLLIKLGYAYNKRPRSNSDSTIISGKLPWWVGLFDVKSFNWVNIEDITHYWGKQFVDELSYWDCHINGSYIVYYNTNKSAIQKVQEICTVSGIRNRIGINRTKEEVLKTLNPGGSIRKSSKDCFMVQMNTNYDCRTYPKMKEVKYSGVVYCAEMPSGTLILKRDKEVFISGNCRHIRAYSELLNVLGLQDKFKDLLEVPEVANRVRYLQKYLSGARSRDDRIYTKSIILFSMFIEHVSLFSQFLIIMSFNKEENVLKGISNVVEATSLEEFVHGDFGAEIVNIIREENPSWFDDDMDNMIESACKKAYKAECELVDWIYGEGELDFLPKNNVKEFIKNRFNIVLVSGGFKEVFEVDQELLEGTEWFEVQLQSVKEDDFFDKTPVAYNKNSKSITADDLF